MLFLFVMYRCIINTSNRKTEKGIEKMTVKERVLTIKLMEKMKRDPAYAKQLGLGVVINSREEENLIEKKRFVKEDCLS